MTTTPENDNDNNNPDAGAAGSDIPDVIDLGAADDAVTEGVSAEEHRKIREERDKLLYLAAESQNMRKRLQSEKEQAVQYANQTLIRSLVPIIDNFERALAVDTVKTDAATVLKGLQLVHDQMMAELRKQAVEVIDPKPGEVFDPTQHEALMQIDNPKFKPNTIIQARTRGYALHARTLRPAGVMVAK